MTARILVIDDRQDGCTPVGDILYQEGYHVIWSSPLFRSLFALEWVQPDLIVVDAPTQEAWQLLHRLTIYQPTFSIPIILCIDTCFTGAGEQEDMVVGLDAIHQVTATAGRVPTGSPTEQLLVLRTPFTEDEFVSIVRRSLSANCGSGKQLATQCLGDGGCFTT